MKWTAIESINYFRDSFSFGIIRQSVTVGMRSKILAFM